MARFSTLDALRGIAAIGVMLWHTPGHPLALQGGYLAVDLFFGLSGFVMALNYEDRLRQGMAVGRFMALRAARLWPMLFLGALPAVLIAGAWPGLLVLVPAPWSPALFPAVPVYWSLLYEVVAYLVFALVAPRLGLHGLAAVMAASGLVLVSLVVTSSVHLHEYGPFWVTIPHCLARVGYSFTCGVLVYRLRLAQKLPRGTSRLAWLLPGGLVLLMALVPTPGQLQGLLGILLIIPGMLWLATRWELPHTRLAAALSDLSYPLYCVHMQGLAVLGMLGVPMVLAWPALVALSLALDRWWDRPMRRMLREVAEGGWRPQFPS